MGCRGRGGRRREEGWKGEGAGKEDSLYWRVEVGELGRVGRLREESGGGAAEGGGRREEGGRRRERAEAGRRREEGGGEADGRGKGGSLYCTGR